MASKGKLRSCLLTWRSNLNLELVREKSLEVCQRAYEGFDWSSVRRVCCYKVLEGSGELDPSYLLERLARREKTPQVVLVDVSQQALEPKGQFDVIIVPVVGFTTDNHRLGMGGGWYDRFLSTQPGARKLGLAYKEALVQFSAEGHDIALDVVFVA